MRPQTKKERKNKILGIIDEEMAIANIFPKTELFGKIKEDHNSEEL